MASFKVTVEFLTFLHQKIHEDYLSFRRYYQVKVTFKINLTEYMQKLKIAVCVVHDLNTLIK